MEQETNLLLNSLFRVLGQLQGINFQASRYLKGYASAIEQEFRRLPFSHLSTSLVLLDLKAKNKKEASQIYTGHGYGVNNEHASKQCESNINFYCSLSLSYGYELFETFIKRTLSIIADFDESIITENVKQHELKKKDAEICFDNLSSGSNNENYFKVLRRICPDILKTEQQNCRKLNLSDWYKAFSIFRHSVIHKNIVCTTESYEKNKNMIEKYFPIIDNENTLKFKITYNNLADNLILIGEYAHLISSELGKKYEFKINKP